MINPTSGPTERCWWCGDDPLYIRYHDNEWGFPVDDERRLFEKICLEGFQSGLSWLTILRKREAFREAFHNFEFERVAGMNAVDVDKLMGNAGIVRHRGKIASAINNARRARELAQEYGTIAAYFWRWEPKTASRPQRLTRETLLAMPATSESTALATDLKRRGWSFVGPTTIYAFMQAMGLVNDHVHTCAQHAAAEAARRAAGPPGHGG